MEGVDGIVTEKQSAPTGPFYGFAREQITAEVNAAAQGAFNAAMGVASISMGLSGLPLVALITPGTMGFCLIRVLIAHIAGFIVTYLLGFEDP
jgi:PTS system sucrose-specific IIC component